MEKRNFRQSDLGLDIHRLDGYRVVYEDTNKGCIARLINDSGTVEHVVVSVKKQHVFAYSEMIKLYLRPDSDSIKRVNEIKNLFEQGLNMTNIAKKFGVTRNTISFYFKYYNIDGRYNYSAEVANHDLKNLGINIDELDGYKVVCEKNNNKRGYRYIMRMIDNDGEVIAMSKTGFSKLECFAMLIQNYVNPKESTILKVDTIKKLYNSGMSKIDIAKTLKITSQSLNDYFYFYNLDNRNNF